MANAMFVAAKQGFIGGDIALDTDDVRLIFVDHTDDTPVPATDDFLDDIGAAARVAISSSGLTGKSITSGVFDATDWVMPTVSGDQFESIVIYQHTGTEGTSRLILFIDTATGLPCTPNGADITVAWDNGANKIFALT